MTRCRNSISDVPGLAVGHAHDSKALTGVTVVLPEKPVVAAVDVRGGGPGTRETDAIGLAGTVDHVHGIVLSGGSAFGLSAASGVQAFLAKQGKGFAVAGVHVPIVPQAILFDLVNGGDLSAAQDPQVYERLALSACKSASESFALGSAGAGFGATTSGLRGGLGSASADLGGGLVVGALVAANAAGSATIGMSRHFWAAPFEKADEFGGAGFPNDFEACLSTASLKGMGGSLRQSPLGENTTLAVVATNAKLTKAQAYRLAVMAQTGLARSLYPVHTPLDGDSVFVMATGAIELADDHYALARLGSHGADVLARAVARGVYEAGPEPANWAGPPSYKALFGE